VDFRWLTGGHKMLCYSVNVCLTPEAFPASVAVRSEAVYIIVLYG
jgi:hypothetical protein